MSISLSKSRFMGWSIESLHQPTRNAGSSTRARNMADAPHSAPDFKASGTRENALRGTKLPKNRPIPEHGWESSWTGCMGDSQVAPGGRWLFALHSMSPHHQSDGPKYSVLHVYDLLESTIGIEAARFVDSARLSCWWGKIGAFHRGPEPNTLSVLVVPHESNK
jgi:hypothetical protein